MGAVVRTCVGASFCSNVNMSHHQEINVENKTAGSLTSAEEINQKLSQLFGEEIAKAFEGKPWILECRARTRCLHEL